MLLYQNIVINQLYAERNVELNSILTILIYHNTDNEVNEDDTFAEKRMLFTRGQLFKDFFGNFGVIAILALGQANKIGDGFAMVLGQYITTKSQQLFIKQE